MAGLYRLQRGSDELIPLFTSSGHPDSYEGLYPAWSRDGQWIAFISGPGGKGSDLFRMNVEDGSIAWSPDGQWIAYTAAEGIRKVRVDIKEIQTIVKDRYARNPSWSPDGRRIVFTDGNTVYIVNEDGSQKTQLTDLASRSSDPAWSPDGQWIVFSGYVDGIGDQQLFKIRVDGRELQQITDIRCVTLDPDWIKMPPYESLSSSP